MAINKDEQVKKEYERLREIYKGAEETKLRLVDELLHRASFLKIELSGLEYQIRKIGSVQYSNKGNARITTAYKSYLQTVSVYQNVIKAIDKIMESTTVDEDDAFDEFIKQAKESVEKR